MSAVFAYESQWKNEQEAKEDSMILTIRRI